MMLMQESKYLNARGTSVCRYALNAPSYFLNRRISSPTEAQNLSLRASNINLSSVGSDQTTNAPPVVPFVPAVLPPPAFVHPVLELTAASFDSFLNEGGPGALVMIDFYTDSCGPCKLMVPHFETLPAIFKKTRFGKFNCGLDLHMPLATRHRIKALPTFKLYRGGRLVDEMTGGRPVQLRQMLVHWSRP